MPRRAAVQGSLSGHGVEGFFREGAHLSLRQQYIWKHGARGAADHRHPADGDDGARLCHRLAILYPPRPIFRCELARQHEVLYKFLLNKWYFDEIYDALIVEPTKCLGRLLWKGGDGWLIDGFGPDGVSARVLDVTRNVVRLQSGYTLSLRLRHAHRRGCIHHLVHVCGAASMSWPVLSFVTFLPLLGAVLIRGSRARRRLARTAAPRAGSRCGRRSSPLPSRWC